MRSDGYCVTQFSSGQDDNAASIICGHNHPSSGDPTPSQEDKALTAKLVEAGKLLRISVLDHVIIGEEERYISFADEGLL